MILSFEPVRRYLESEEKSIVLTGAEWPFMMEQLGLTELDQSLTVSSFEAEAIMLPRGLIATSLTAPLCPTNLKGRI